MYRMKTVIVSKQELEYKPLGQGRKYGDKMMLDGFGTGN